MTWYTDLHHEQAGGDGGVRSITQFVVIHATDNTASAAAEANYAEIRPDHIVGAFLLRRNHSHPGAGHRPHRLRLLPDRQLPKSVQVEISGLSNQLTDASLRRVAPVVARVCQEYGLPIRKVSSADLVGGAKGICGHIDVTYAWGEGDHTDPGASASRGRRSSATSRRP
jgi:hypothetical protein